MRHSIGGVWLFQLMILFILIFVAYIALTLNYSKTVKLKNEVISMVERYDGLNEQSISLVNNYLESSNYVATGVCASEETDGIYGALSLSEDELEPAEPNTRYYYCVKKYRGTNQTRYYQVTLFYRFNLPVIGDTIRYMIKGTTTNFHSKDNNTLYGYMIGGGLDTSMPSIPNTPSYTVSFDVNGGDYNVPRQTVEAGNTATKPTNPTRSGYTFECWQLNGVDYHFNERVTKSITLVAKWKSNSESELITIKFDVGGGTPISDQQIPPGSKVIKPSDPVRDKYVFKGWRNGGHYYEFDKFEHYDLTLSAQWDHTIVDYFKENAHRIVEARSCLSGCDGCFFGLGSNDPAWSVNEFYSTVCDAYIRDNPGVFTKNECVAELNSEGDGRTIIGRRLQVTQKCEPGDKCYSLCTF